MCDLENNNSKCCGTCTHPETEEKPILIHCDFCDTDTKTPVTKDWQNTGWTVCEDCETDKEKLAKILLEELQKRTDSEYELHQNYNRLKQAFINDMKYLTEKTASPLPEDLLTARCDLAFINGFASKSSERINAMY